MVYEYVIGKLCYCCSKPIVDGSYRFLGNEPHCMACYRKERIKYL